MQNPQEAFDRYAATYDESFTFSHIGKLQRNRVRDCILPFIRNKRLNILEINCGTGEDALWMANYAEKVMASDLSPEMITLCESKKLISGITNVHFRPSGFHNLKDKHEGEKFHFVLSNFGGLNCINPAEMEQFAEDLAALMQPDGHFTAVFMGRYCLWETLYFLAKGQPGKAFRRWTDEEVLTRMGEYSFHTWYYTTGELKKIFTRHFECIAAKPVAFFVPPSYMENYFSGKTAWLHRLNRLDNRITRFSLFSNMADHFIMTFKLRLHL